MIQRFMFGLGPISSLYDFLTLVVMIVTYLGLVQVVKRRFYEASGWRA